MVFSMTISEKQISQLMESARILSIDESYPFEVRKLFSNLIYDINNQQSENLKVIEDE